MVSSFSFPLFVSTQFFASSHKIRHNLSMSIHQSDRPCPVCTVTDKRPFLTPPSSPGPLVKCLHCGFIYAHPLHNMEALIVEGPVLGERPSHLTTSNNLDDIKGSWEEEIINKYFINVSLRQANAQQALADLQKHTSLTEGNLLDVGAFCGVFLNEAKQAGWQVTGIEPLVMPAIYGRATYGLNIINDTLHPTTFAPNSFDVVTSFQVFEHLVDPSKELAIIQELVRPGGIVMIEVPNVETWSVRLLKQRHRHFVYDHVSFFSADTLGKLMERHGFEVVTAFYPTRVLNWNQLVWWIYKHVQPMGNLLKRVVPDSMMQKPIHLNVGDIVTVIGRKL